MATTTASTIPLSPRIPSHPTRVTVVLTFADAANKLHHLNVAKNYPSAPLIRFSASARRQILEKRSSHFEIISRSRCFHRAMVSNIHAVLIYLREMAHLSTPPPFEKPPFLFVQFDESLFQALLCLETVKFFDLDEFWRQDHWIRKWIMHWLNNYDVNVQELVCAYWVFRGDPVDGQLADVHAERAVLTWDARSLYFLKIDQQWVKHILQVVPQLFGLIKNKIDAMKGPGAFARLWAFATHPGNFRDPTWYQAALAHSQQLGFSDVNIENGRVRYEIRKSRKIHDDILHKAINKMPPQLTPDQIKKYFLDDDRWVWDVETGRNGEEIKVWEYLSDDEMEELEIDFESSDSGMPDPERSDTPAP